MELQRILPGISTEQLRSRLNRMVADGMLTRKRYREVPPRVDYELTERARQLMPILGELGRWGYRWAWSPPRASESVDIGAIFRLAPGLLGRDQRPLGRVELTVSPERGQDGEGASYTLTVSGQGTALQEHATELADARVKGTTAAWVSALSPQGDRDGLEITGEHELATVALDSLALASESSTDAARAVA